MRLAITVAAIALLVACTRIIDLTPVPDASTGDASTVDTSEGSLDASEDADIGDGPVPDASTDAAPTPDASI